MCKFLMGLGLGSVLGAVMVRCAQTDKAKEWKKKMCCAAQQAAEKAGEWMTGAKERADEMADDAKSKFQSYSGK